MIEDLKRLPEDVKMVFAALIVVSLSGFLAAGEVSMWLTMPVFFFGLALAVKGVWPNQTKMLIAAIEQSIE